MTGHLQREGKSPTIQNSTYGNGALESMTHSGPCQDLVCTDAFLLQTMQRGQCALTPRTSFLPVSIQCILILRILNLRVLHCYSSNSRCAFSYILMFAI